MSWFGGFDLKVFKPNLKMAIHRIKLTSSKKAAALRKERREVSELLKIRKYDKARIRVESIIRKENDIEAGEVVELMCDLLHERAPLMKAEKSCPMDLVESVSTLIWAAHRMPIPELATVRKQLTKKYGKDFASGAATGTNGKVNTKVIHRLSVTPPSISLVSTTLVSIAREYDVAYNPEDDMTGLLARDGGPDDGPDGSTVPMMPSADDFGGGGDDDGGAGAGAGGASGSGGGSGGGSHPDVPDKTDKTLTDMPPAPGPVPGTFPAPGYGGGGGGVPPPPYSAHPAGYGVPPAAGYGAPPAAGYGAPPAGYGAPPAGYGAPPAGYGAPPAGYGAPPATGYAVPPAGYGGAPAGYPGAAPAPAAAPAAAPGAAPPMMPAPPTTAPGSQPPAAGGGGDLDDYDNLTSRFAALRKS